jgi:hypothetical protein
MKKTLIIFPILFIFHLGASAAEWHVSGVGNDANNGTTSSKAFRTLQKAESVVQPGDTVLVGDGEYVAAKEGNEAVLYIKSSGKPNAWITWKAAPNSKPVIRPNGWNAILITGSYQIIDGFTIIGNNDAIVLDKALADAKLPTPNPYFNTNGITVNGRKVGPDAKPHHIIIRNNTVAKTPGGGINVMEADYITIEDNKVYQTAWFMRYGGSGISMLDNWAYDNAPGYHVIIQRNYVWENKTLVPWERVGKLSDGNGIILDVTDQETQGATNMNADAVVKADAAPPKPKRPEWTGHTLVANNLSAFNGGSGIHTFRTADVDVINNTTYWNGQTVGYPEMFANASRNVRFFNNILVPRPAGRVTVDSPKNSNIAWDYNLYPVAQDVYKAANDIVAVPKFVRIEREVNRADFRLAKDSQALDSGTDELAQPSDINGSKRPAGKRRDRGAFEQ